MDVQSATGTKEPLTYEETPVIEPVLPVAGEPSPPESALPEPEEELALPSPKPRRGGIMGTLGMAGLFIILFFVGVGISVSLRQYLGSRGEASLTQNTPVTPSPTASPTPLFSDVIALPASATATLSPALTAWKTHTVISGTTKKPIPGLTFGLPAEVLAPVCDGGSCASQGTYLPGGSRFTVASRGRGQLLVDARGQVGLSDGSGKSFTVKQVTLTSGKRALEYTGEFQGSTVGGYSFTRMHGFMIEIDEGMSLEMNHFAPAGLNVAYADDEMVFAKTVASVTVEKNPLSTITLTPTPAPTPVTTVSPTP